MVYVSRVTVGEVERHIANDVAAAHVAFEGFREKAQVRILKNVSGKPLHNIFQGFDAAHAKEVLLTQFRAFLEEAKVHVLELTNISVDEVFEKYFANTPPFATDKKKNEFPDAFSLAAIERWCKESSRKMYVVSTDTDWQQACALDPSSLTYTQSLPEFLDLLSQGQKLAEDVSQLFKAHQLAVLEKIKDNVEPLNLIYEPYGDLQYVSVNSVRIVKHYLIEVDDGKAIFDVVTEVSYSANILYRNSLLMMTMGIMGAREEIEYGSTNVRAEVTVAFDQKNLEWVAVDAVHVTHESIYVFPDEEPEDFARKFTTAQKALSKHVSIILHQLGGSVWVAASSTEAIIQRFEGIKASLPLRIMLDLQTLNMVNSATGGLNLHGANTVKDSVIRRTPQSSRTWKNSLTSNFSAINRRAFEAANTLDSASIRHLLNNAQMFNQSAISRWTEMSQHLHRSPLSGHYFPRDLLLDINPKRSEDVKSDGVPSVRVEVSRNADVYGPDGVSAEEKDKEELEDTAAFDFSDSPITVTLSHNLSRPKPLQTQHKLRKPANEQWGDWGRSIQRWIRYLSREEIDSELGEREIDGDSVVSTQTYNEGTASEELYDQLILEVAGFKLERDDEFPADQFRSLSRRLIEDIRFEIKTAVIRRLYRCYCELKRQPSGGTEQTVLQYIDLNSESFQLRHILRSPRAEESDEFRTTIVRGSFSVDEENREVVDLKLDLSVAARFYDRLLSRIENATMNGLPFGEDTRSSFLQAINPVYKLRVVERVFDVNAWYFIIDDFQIP